MTWQLSDVEARWSRTAVSHIAQDSAAKPTVVANAITYRLTTNDGVVSGVVPVDAITATADGFTVAAAFLETALQDSGVSLPDSA